jgi:hypothetical protein
MRMAQSIDQYLQVWLNFFLGPLVEVLLLVDGDDDAYQ